LLFIKTFKIYISEVSIVLAENDSLIKDHGADFLQLENDLGILGEEA
jgi:acyl-CoA oxidase